jgi:hypothetical protein
MQFKGAIVQKTFTLTGLVLFVFSLPVSAYMIDGNLSDWGVHQNGTAADWTPNAQAKAWVEEDQTGGLSSRLTPGYGGQAYDVEAMYLDYDAQYLYLALITGHNPLTPNSGGSYAPGDFAIDFGRNGSYEFGIETLGNGNVQGGVYAVTQWGAGLWGAANEGPTSILTGDLLGLADVVYTTTGVANMGAYASDTHYFYEARIPTALFGTYWGKDRFTVHWTMNCANDSLKIYALPASIVPEPGTLALLPIGFIGMKWLSKRRRKAAR